ncbi:MAG: dihydroorotase [Deltaproteobacteria bacterium]|nr:dihydroorotase [Deltaproteobacteria bacterium]
MKRSLLIKNGYLIDPLNRKKGNYDLFINGDRIIEIARTLRHQADQVIDAKGMVVCPGFIDLHTHLREPGFEYKETIRTGTEAAAAGGFTTIVCMANTQPVNDNAVITEFIREKARSEGIVNVLPVGSISRGLKGEALSDIGQMAEAGIIGISDDGKTVMNSALMRKALQYARGFELLVISHCEDENLSGESSINEGLVATELGLPGSPNAAEELMIARDIALAELTKARLHIAHLTTRVGLELVAAAKKRGVRVTCEATPHHLTLTDEDVRGYRRSCKVRPPLRTDEDRRALLKGIQEGIVDAIATDHAPHATFEKEIEFVNASNGIIGLETALPVMLGFVQKKQLTLDKLLHLLTAGPAAVLGLKAKGHLGEGRADADLVLFDPEETVVIDASKFRSKSRNCPFDGWKLKGKVHQTIVGGKVVYDKGTSDFS